MMLIKHKIRGTCVMICFLLTTLKLVKYIQDCFLKVTRTDI